MELVSRVEAVAAEKGCTPAQLALAWVMAKGDTIVPIPGTKRRKYLEENCAAADVQLSAADITKLDAAVPKGATAGPRYPEAAMKRVNI
jgi:aryl-alcohol dehydrogenase-like predicted oxidoreductase